MTNARILTIDGKISGANYKIDPNGPDRKGNILLFSNDGSSSIRVHPRRVLPVRNGGAIVSLTNDLLRTKCPKCKKSLAVRIGQEANCPTHGNFLLDWAEMKAGGLPMTIEQHTNEDNKKQLTTSGKRQVKQPVSTDIDFAYIKSKGELWTKSNVSFDYPDFNVKAHTLLLDGDPARKFCFNSYNGTWGKKNRKSQLEDFLNNINSGFVIKDSIDKERKRLTKAEYQRDA